ncbi:MAG TPA: tetratricopeptide repeat protein [Pirellulales bacterium]|nr:tetratricopeptide repeat protein [Pirellulales bacterium]
MPLRLSHFTLAWLLALAIVARLPADEASDQYSTAAGHYAASRWQLAADEFATLLKKFPEHPRVAEATFFRGEALVQLGQPALAEPCFSELLRRWPDSRWAPQAMFRRGEAAYLVGHDRAARAALEQFIKRFPNDARNAYALVYLGETLLAEGDATAAKRLFSQALETYPNGPMAPECRLGLGKTDEALGNIDDARQTFGMLAGMPGPLADEAHYRLGVLENGAGNYEAAVEALEVLAQRAADKGADPALIDKAANAQGWALYKLERYHEAQRCLAAVVERDAANDEAQFCLGLARAGGQHWEEAIAPLELVVERAADPNRVTHARAALAICYGRAGRLEEAKKSFQTFVASEPPAELAHATTYWLAEGVLSKDPTWASELFESLTKEGAASDYSARALAGLAWCQLQLSDAVGSAATFERLLKTYPDDARAPEAALVRGQALEMIDQSEPALAMYDLVVQRYAGSKQYPDALWKAAGLEQRLSRMRQAEAHYRQLAAVEPAFGQYDALLYHWSQTLSELSRDDEAAEVLERLRRDFADSPLVPDATYLLAEHALAAKNYDLADRLAHEVSAIDPPPKILPEVLYLEGRVALAREAWGDVAEPLSRLARECPDSPLVLAARFWQAEASYRQREYVRAQEEFAQLEGQTAGRTERWLAMIPLRQAQSLGQQNRWAEALEIANRIAGEYPNFEEQYEADYVIGRSLASQGEFAAAREAYGRVIRSISGSKTETAAMAQWMIGETFFHQESYEEAVAAYLRVEILYDWPKWQSGALLQAAKCQELLGQYQQAIEIYDRLIKTYPDSEFTEEAKRRLRLAQKHEASPTAKRSSKGSAKG